MSDENLLHQWQDYREQIEYAHHVLDVNEAPKHPDAEGTCNLTVGGRITMLASQLRYAKEAAEQRLISVTYGELHDAAPEVANEIQGHEWDNKNTAEQMDYLLTLIRREKQAKEAAERERDELYASAKELADMLREEWKAPEADAVTLFCAALMAGFAAAWKENPPKNGFVSSVAFKECGRLQIEVRRIDGKGAAESLMEVTQENTRLRSQLEQERGEDSALLDWWEAHLNYEPGMDWDTGEVIIYRVTGGINDREWREAARGENLRAALRVAKEQPK